MIKKFEEFIEEGLISDYKKQEDAKNKEISDSEKNFVLEVLKQFDEIDVPFAFICKNCALISDSVNEEKGKVITDRDKVEKSRQLDMLKM